MFSLRLGFVNTEKELNLCSICLGLGFDNIGKKINLGKKILNNTPRHHCNHFDDI
jgi:hypothetical protein